MTSCEICGEENDEMFNGHCGISWCYVCDARFLGRCPVCQRDELNMELECDCCEKVGTNITIHQCEYCADLFCNECLDINDIGYKICCKNFLCVEKDTLKYLYSYVIRDIENLKQQ